MGKDLNDLPAGYLASQIRIEAEAERTQPQGKGLAPQKAKVTLPGAGKAHSFKWSYGVVALKSDGKTPDASVSGFQRAGD